MAHTENNKQLLVLPAWAERLPDGTWEARIPGDGTDLAGLGGIYASGENFFDARENLATNVWLAIKSGAAEGISPHDVGKLHLRCTTPKSFDIDKLEANLADET